MIAKIFLNKSVIFISVKNRKESWASQQSNFDTSFIFPGRKISSISTNVRNDSLQRRVSSVEADSSFDPLMKQQVEWNVRQVKCYTVENETMILEINSSQTFNTGSIH